MEQDLIDYHILSFYGWWQFAVCLFACAALLSIWWHVGKKLNDFGQVWLAFSILCWSFSGLVEIYFASFMTDAHTEINLAATSQKLQGWRSIFSLLNSLFILLALPWFKYIPKRIEGLIKSKYWLWIVLVPFIFSLLPTLRAMFSSNQIILTELDMYYGIFTLSFLGWVLWESFTKRRLHVLAYLSLICILITFVTQIYKLSDLYINLTLLSSIFKTTLIMIFFALALSWVKDITEVLNLDPKKIFVKLTYPNTKAYPEIAISGIQYSKFITLNLSKNQNALMSDFIVKKYEGKDWLEIKPKAEKRSERKYDINDHNEIKRLITAILDNIFGKDLWTKNQHGIPLKDSLFQFSEEKERHIQLSVPKKNITIVKS